MIDFVVNRVLGSLSEIWVGFCRASVNERKGYLIRETVVLIVNVLHRDAANNTI